MKETFLSFEIIWSDPHMIELSVGISNGTFMGRTEIYESRDDLLNFANSLIQFPHNQNHKVIYTCGDDKSYSFFEVSMAQLNETGKIQIIGTVLENINGGEKRIQSRIQTEIHTEPNLIDSFRNELLRVHKEEKGKAVLVGLPQYD